MKSVPEVPICFDKDFPYPGLIRNRQAFSSGLARNRKTIRALFRPPVYYSTDKYKNLCPIFKDLRKEFCTASQNCRNDGLFYEETLFEFAHQKRGFDTTH